MRRPRAPRCSGLYVEPPPAGAPITATTASKDKSKTMRFKRGLPSRGRCPWVPRRPVLKRGLGTQSCLRRGVICTGCWSVTCSTWSVVWLQAEFVREDRFQLSPAGMAVVICADEHVRRERRKARRDRPDVQVVDLDHPFDLRHSMPDVDRVDPRRSRLEQDRHRVAQDRPRAGQHEQPDGQAGERVCISPAGREHDESRRRSRRRRRRGRPAHACRPLER